MDVIIVIITTGWCWIIIQLNKEKNEESMVGDAGYFIHNTHNINTIIDTDDNEGWKLMSWRSMTLIFNLLLKRSVDGRKLLDLTFNGLSDVYPAFEAASFSATSENSIKIDGFRGATEHIGFSPDMTNEYDIHIDAFALTLQVCTYEAQCIHKSSIESISSFNSRTFSESSPFSRNVMVHI